MAEVECEHCSQVLPLVQAFRCVCGNVVFCSQECFDRNSHSKIEDDEHEFANSLESGTVDVKLSRLIGKGKYVDLVNKMTNLIIEKQIVRKTQGDASQRTFQLEIKRVVDEFSRETKGPKTTLQETLTAYLKACEPKCTSQELDRISERVITIWSSDAPLAKKNIDLQMKTYNVAVASFFASNGGETEKQNLLNQSSKLGYALNGKRK